MGHGDAPLAQQCSHSAQINSAAEEQQGKAIVHAAVAYGVHHFVYSSGDRGGPEKSSVNPTQVKNFGPQVPH